MSDNRVVPKPLMLIFSGGFFVFIIGAIVYFNLLYERPTSSEAAGQKQPPKTAVETKNKPTSEKEKSAKEQSKEIPPSEAKKPTEKIATAPGDGDRKPEIKGGFKIISGTIRSSIYESFSRNFDETKEGKLLSEKVAAHFKRVFLFDLNFRRDVLQGDRYAAAFSESNESTDGVRILAAIYESKKLKKKLVAVYYQGDGAAFGRYYSPDGTERQLRMKNAPIKDYEIITSLLYDRKPRHNGIDFKAPVGTPVYTPWDAKVLRKNWNSHINGNCLDIEYIGKGAHAYFLHLDSIANGVEAGKKLPAGALLGMVGNSGRSSAPHLHYQLMDGEDKVLDPFKYHGSQSERAPAAISAKLSELWKRWEPELKKAIESQELAKN
ncbi:MAG: hypothetical protein Kow0090_15930 [Myxococcota bacterium]